MNGASLDSLNWQPAGDNYVYATDASLTFDTTYDIVSSTGAFSALVSGVEQSNKGFMFNVAQCEFLHCQSLLAKVHVCTCSRYLPASHIPIFISVHGIQLYCLWLYGVQLKFVLFSYRRRAHPASGCPHSTAQHRVVWRLCQFRR